MTNLRYVKANCQKNYDQNLLKHYLGANVVSASNEFRHL